MTLRLVLPLALALSLFAFACGGDSIRDDDEDVERVLVPNPEGTGATGCAWHITQVPGIERCGS